MGVKCKATRNNGQPCEGYTLAKSEYCYAHDPTRAAERAAARKLGGLNRRTPHGGDPAGLPRQIRTLADVLSVLDYTLAETLVLENGIARGRLLVAICGELINAISNGDLAERVAALEALNVAKK